MADTDLPQRVELALAQAKKIRRESTIVIQMLGGIRDTLQPEGHKENHDTSSNSEAD